MPGTIVYQTRFTGAADPLELARLRHNVAVERTVVFDGTRARIDEINADHGVRGPSVQVVSAGGAMVYGKQLHRLRFSVDRPAPDQLGGREEGPRIEPLDGTPVIVGLPCRRVRFVDGGRRLAIDYTDQLTVDDPTGAVTRFEGVSGLVLGWEDLERDGWRARTEVTLLSTEPPDPAQLELPDDYPRFDSVEAARAEDRRMVEAETAATPAADPRSFLGRWRWQQGDVIVEIAGDDGGGLRFRTIAPDGVRSEPAAVKGRLLLVEAPPGFRLYHLDDGDLVLDDDPVFRFRRPA